MKALFVAYLAIVLSALIGWGLNLVALVHLLVDPHAEINLLALARIVGVFFVPLGAALGWLV